MQIHNGVVAATVPIHVFVRVESDDDVVALFCDLLQEVHVTHVKEIEGPGHVNDAVIWFRLLSLCELDDLLRRRQELTDAGIRGVSRFVPRHGRRSLPTQGLPVRVWDMVLFGQEEHATHQIRGRDSGCPLTLAVTTGLFHEPVCVVPVCIQCDVVPMDGKVTAVLVQCLQCRDIRRSFHHLIDPFNGPDHCIPLFRRENRRSFMQCDLPVRVDPDTQVVAQ